MMAWAGGGGGGGGAGGRPLLERGWLLDSSHEWNGTACLFSWASWVHHVQWGAQLGQLGPPRSKLLLQGAHGRQIEQHA